MNTQSVDMLPMITLCIILTLLFVWWTQPEDEDKTNQLNKRGGRGIKDNPIGTIAARSNWTGVPKDGLTRNDVYEGVQVVPLATEIKPNHCPTCYKKLNEYKSDFDITKREFKVTGVFCTRGHWTWLTWR